MKIFHWCLLGSLGFHGMIWLGLPNPIPSKGASPSLEIIGLTPVIELPSTLPPTSESTPDFLPIVPPVAESLSVPPLDLTASIPPPSKDFPTDISFEKIPNTIPPAIGNRNTPAPVAIPPPKETPETISPPREKPPKIVIIPKEIPFPEPSPPPQEAPAPPPSIALNAAAYTREFGDLYVALAKKCGAQNVLRRTIPAPDEDLVSQVSVEIEMGVGWIPPVSAPPPEILQNLDIQVKATLVVEEDGSISRRRFLSSDLAIIDGIISKTLDAYEGKFEPLPGKCRLVTINYKFPYNSR